MLHVNSLYRLLERASGSRLRVDWVTDAPCVYTQAGSFSRWSPDEVFPPLFVCGSVFSIFFFGTFINYLNLESLSKYRSAHRARLLTTTSSTTQRLDSYVNSFLISFCFLWPPRQPHLATVIVVRNLSTLRLEPILLVDIPSNMTESFHQ